MDLLNEMPYLEFQGGKITFDLELERFMKNNDKVGCINFIRAILEGHPFKDKYGDILHLHTVPEREEFKRVLINSYQFNKVMQHLGISTHKLFLVPVSSFKDYHEAAMTSGGPGSVFGNTTGEYAKGDARVPKILGPIQTRPVFQKKPKKKKLKESFEEFFLTENNDGKHDYSCTMAMVPPLHLSLFKTFAKKIDKSDLGEHSIEKESHCTILYGTHTDDIKEIKDVLKNTKLTKIKMKLKGLSTFPPGDNGLVLKVDIESEDLNKLNKALKNLKFTSDFPKYHPHITVAYLKDDVDKKKYLKSDPFKGRTIITTEIMFSSKSGKKTRFKLNEL